MTEIRNTPSPHRAVQTPVPAEGGKSINALEPASTLPIDAVAADNHARALPRPLPPPQAPQPELCEHAVTGARSFAAQLEALGEVSLSGEAMMLAFLKLQVLEGSQEQQDEALLELARGLLARSAYSALSHVASLVQEMERLTDEAEQLDSKSQGERTAPPENAAPDLQAAARAEGGAESQAEAADLEGEIRSLLASTENIRARRSKSEGGELPSPAETLRILLSGTREDKKALDEAWIELDKSRNAVARLILAHIDQRQSASSSQRRDFRP